MNENMRALRIVVYAGTVVSGVIALAVILTACYLTIFEQSATAPDIISNWGGIIVGFYFGSFVALAKDLLIPSNDKTQDSDGTRQPVAKIQGTSGGTVPPGDVKL